MEEKEKSYKVYKRRFAILITVVMLNISNAALWINSSPVATTVANFYNVETQKVNWFSLVFMVVTMPFAFFSTFIIDKIGLKFGIYLGATLNCGGAVIRAIGTSGLFNYKNTQYAISLTGQVIAAMSQSFLLFIPTKVSQMWFPESQRAVATTVLAMSNPLGIVIAEAASPLIVMEDEENVPLNNYVWMGVAIFSLILTFISVTRGKPKTPPSLSAEKGEKERPPYLEQLIAIFTCIPYLLLLLTLGCGVGVFNAVATLTQQILCPLGYSEVFSGLTCAIMVFVGFFGSAALGILVDKTKLFGEVTKVAFGCACIALIILFEFYLLPNQGAALLVFAGVFGFLGIGAYPVGLELAVEVTYPIEETMSTAFIFLSGQIQGIVIIALVPVLSTAQRRSTVYLNECEAEEGDTFRDYSIPLMVIMSYMTLIVCSMILFMKLKYKRLEAEREKGKIKSESDEDVSALSQGPSIVDITSQTFSISTTE